MGSKIVLDLDPAELAVRMCEANYGITRPAGMTYREAFDALDDDVRAGWLRSAKVAADYIAERIDAATRMQ